jgi:hypothetical protein
MREVKTAELELRTILKRGTHGLGILIKNPARERIRIMKSRFAVVIVGLLLLLQCAAICPAEPPTTNTGAYLRELRAGNPRFSKSLNGIITDRQTGLQWYCGYFFERKDWHQVSLWAKNLKAGGGGWRLATMDELAAIYPAAAAWGGFPVDWTYSALVTTSSPAPGANPSYKEYTITTGWWRQSGKIPSHYGIAPVVGSLSLLDGSAIPHLAGPAGTGRVRVSMAVRRAPK